jgi:hypothetical protein
MAHDIAGLERKIRTLKEAISKLHDADYTGVLTGIVHRPGWTTVRELEFVLAAVENTQNQVGTLHKSLDALVTIADKIGDK